jgi:gliding-associated putative ABC transporter substrate-binding component GldG
LLTQTDSQRILFLEGHGEWNDEDLAEIMDYLSYEYTIDRGVLSDDSPALDMYDLIIIAGPQSPFSEQDKFIIDQYLMRGGSLLWFVNGVQLRSYDELAQQGETISIANDLNLGDLFFTYGLRINPVVLQDSQCLNIPIVRNDTLNHTDYIEKPWYYAPLLQVNEQSKITKGLSFVKTEFASTLSLVGDRPSIRKEILLTSSRLAHSVPVPARISLEETDRQPDKNYFNESQLPVAVLLSGTFPSVFNNRVIRSQENKHFLSESKPTQLILAASEEIIRSGYDRYSQTQFANRELVLNMVNHLTDNEKIGQLKNKNLQIQLLNKQQLQQNQMKIILFNIILPPSIILVLFVILSTIRTGKYKRKTVK